MKRILPTLLLALLLAACDKPDRTPTSTARNASTDSTFQRYAKEYISGYLAWRPLMATGLGLHEYDGQFTDYSRASIDSELARLKGFRAKLAALDTTTLSRKMFYDYRILGSAIASEIFSFDDMGSYTNNPMTYAGAIDVNIYVKRDFAPLEDRVRSIIAIERHAHALFAAARSNLADTLPRPFVETAIEIAGGSADFLKKDLVTALANVTNDSLMKTFRGVNDFAISELNNYVKYLKTEKLPRSNNHYALGRGKFSLMLASEELITLPPEKILEIGMSALKKEQEAFAAAAHIIDPSKKPVDVYREIQRDHPTAEGLIPDTRRDLEMIVKFIRDHNIISIPSSVPASVEETPQYERATSFASMDTPGPFEKKATEAYYYVTPVESKWTSKQKEEWLTAFNYYTTDVVSIHEAYPGHYVQFLHLNASPATDIEKIFGSYAYTEGWAHYTEKMMLDEGFGADSGALRGAKYRLAQSGESLLRLCRLCVSIRTHCQGMLLDEATKFFQDNCYYEEKPSHQEALRGTYDPGYLYYTLGKLEILKLRDDYKRQEGAGYSLKKFNEAMVDNGMPPIRLLREVLLRDSTSYGEIL